MSVGHIARGFEEAEIPTVIIAAKPFEKRLEVMSLPRVLITDNIIGRVMGNPYDIRYQNKVLKKAFNLLASADTNGFVEHIRA
jgi:hypothetical protein